MTPRKNVIMGSFTPDFSVNKWHLISERDRLFDRYCDSLDKLLVWQSPKGLDLAMGCDFEQVMKSRIDIVQLMQDNVNSIREKLLELDQQINELGRTEPPEELT
jgi:hypothetical protein